MLLKHDALMTSALFCYNFFPKCFVYVKRRCDRFRHLKIVIPYS